MAKYLTIAPIVSEYNNRHLFDIPFGDVKIAAKPDLLEDEEIIKHLGTSQKMSIKDSEIAFITECEADSLGEPDPHWKGDALRSKQDVAFEKIQICNLALWLAKPTNLATDTLLHIRVDSTHSFAQQTSSIDPIHPHLEDRNNSHTKESYQLAREINSAVLGIERKHSTWMAFRTLMDALTNLSLEIRFILLWVGLEALFGIDKEISYRISNRIAFFVSNDKREAKKIFLEMKLSYDLRSEIVHGLRISKSKKRDLMKILYNTETAIRRSLLRIFLEKGLVDVFNDEKKRNEFLDNLIYAC